MSNTESRPPPKRPSLPPPMWSAAQLVIARTGFVFGDKGIFFLREMKVTVEKCLNTV